MGLVNTSSSAFNKAISSILIEANFLEKL